MHSVTDEQTDRPTDRR